MLGSALVRAKRASLAGWTARTPEVMRPGPAAGDAFVHRRGESVVCQCIAHGLGQADLSSPGCFVEIGRHRSSRDLFGPRAQCGDLAVERHGLVVAGDRVLVLDGTVPELDDQLREVALVPITPAALFTRARERCRKAHGVVGHIVGPCSLTVGAPGRFFTGQLLRPSPPRGGSRRRRPMTGAQEPAELRWAAFPHARGGGHSLAHGCESTESLIVVSARACTAMVPAVPSGRASSTALRTVTKINLLSLGFSDILAV